MVALAQLMIGPGPPAAEPRAPINQHQPDATENHHHHSDGIFAKALDGGLPSVPTDIAVRDTRRAPYCALCVIGAVAILSQSSGATGIF